jgi:hypothetical protein
MPDDEMDETRRYRPFGEQDGPDAEGGPSSPRADETAARDPAADETAAWDPVADDATAVHPGALDEDATAVHPGALDEDATAVHPGALDEDATAVHPGMPDDATARLPGPDDRTAPLPGADSTSVLPPADTWQARAEVPRAGTTAVGPAVGTEWEQAPTEDGGRWWMPIVVGLVALLLLGVLGYGVWLIAGAGDDDQPAVTPTATVAPTSAAPSPTPSPTGAEPTTAPPAEPQTVAVPDLRGTELADARERLDGLGLPYRLEFRESTEVEEGSVIETDPPGGSQVEPGTEITLVVARPPRQTQAPPTSPVTTPTGEDED